MAATGAPYRELKAQELAASKARSGGCRRVADIDRGAQEAVERQARRSGVGKSKGLKGGTPRIILGGMKDRSEDTSGGNYPVRRASARSKPSILLPPLASVLKFCNRLPCGSASTPAHQQNGPQARRGHRRLRTRSADHPRSCPSRSLDRNASPLQGRTVPVRRRCWHSLPDN